MIKNKKAQELPINILVLIIIGIILFGISIAIFHKFSSSSEDRIQQLQGEIRSSMSGLECENDKYICSPTVKLKPGNEITSNIFIANLKDSNKNFELSINGTTGPGSVNITKSGCGKVKIMFPEFDQNIDSGKSAKVPIIVKANRVKDAPCSFVTVAEVEVGSSSPKTKTAAIIIRAVK